MTMTTTSRIKLDNNKGVIVSDYILLLLQAVLLYFTWGLPVVASKQS